MKKLLIALTLATSLSSFQTKAAEAIPAFAAVTSVLALMGPSMFTTTDMEESTNKKQALQIVEDAQIHYQYGETSVFLKQKIRDVQLSNQALSEDEALDALVAVSIEMLK